WRRRESDLLFRIPYHTAEGDQPALVCVLIEHQSRPDPVMPLRMLLYAVLYWEREWKEWGRQRDLGERLRLSPVVPLIFHTGPTPWKANRELIDLIGGPEAARAFAPRWQPLFWDIAEHSSSELLQATEEWLVALSVVRAERDDESQFRTTLEDALRHVQALSN